MTDWMNLLCWYICWDHVTKYWMFGGYNSIYYEVIASKTSTNCNRLTWRDVVNVKYFCHIIVYCLFIFSLVSLLRMHFLGGRNDRLNEFVMLIYMFIINAMRSSSKRTILHCVESYLYEIILVNKKKNFLRSETWEKINRQYC
jgi:hypothetical protein